VEWEARESAGQWRSVGTVIVDWGLLPGDVASLRMGGSRWRKDIIILGISQIITDGERILSHLARLDARQRGNGTRDVQGTTFPGGHLSMTAGDRHSIGRGRSGGCIVDDLTAASELARGTGG